MHLYAVAQNALMLAEGGAEGRAAEVNARQAQPVHFLFQQGVVNEGSADDLKGQRGAPALA